MQVALFIPSLLGAAFLALLLLSAFLTANLTAMMLAALGLAVALPFPGRMMVATLGGWGKGDFRPLLDDHSEQAFQLIRLQAAKIV